MHNTYAGWQRLRWRTPPEPPSIRRNSKEDRAVQKGHRQHKRRFSLSYWPVTDEIRRIVVVGISIVSGKQLPAPIFFVSGHALLSVSTAAK